MSWMILFRQAQHLLNFFQRITWPKTLHALTLKGPQLTILPGDHIASLFAACSAQVLGTFVALTLDQP